MTILLLFFSSFAIVFLLGLQSLSVNGGHEKAAFFNSTLIGLANITLLKTAPHASGWEIVAYVVGGPLGIVCSMRFFKWYRKQRNKHPAQDVADEVMKVWDDKKARDDRRTDRLTSSGQDDPR